MTCPSVDWISFHVCVFSFVNLFLALINCSAIAVDTFRLAVCWNHILEGRYRYRTVVGACHLSAREMLCAKKAMDALPCLLRG